MRTARGLASLTLSLCFVAGLGRAQAQDVEEPDHLFEVVVGSNGNTVGNPLDFGRGESFLNQRIPSLTINFLQSPTSSLISDQLRIDAFTVNITSDPIGGTLAPRVGAIQVFNSNELINVFGAVAVSDSNPTDPGGTSDLLRLLTPAGALPDVTILEGSSQTFNINLAARTYDIYDPGSTTQVSEYIDIGPITGYFASDVDESTGLTNLPAPDGTVVEPSGVGYSLTFASEPVPEPSSLALLGAAALTGLGYRTFRRRGAGA